MSGTGTRWRLARLGGLMLIAIGFAGMTATFPFISGDPAPGHPATDPSWFRPVANILVLSIGLGILLVCASAIHWLVLRRRAR